MFKFLTLREIQQRVGQARNPFLFEPGNRQADQISIHLEQLLIGRLGQIGSYVLVFYQ